MPSIALTRAGWAAGHGGAEVALVGGHGGGGVVLAADTGGGSGWRRTLREAEVVLAADARRSELAGSRGSGVGFGRASFSAGDPHVWRTAFPFRCSQPAIGNRPSASNTTRLDRQLESVCVARQSCNASFAFCGRKAVGSADFERSQSHLWRATMAIGIRDWDRRHAHYWNGHWWCYDGDLD